MTLRVSNKEYNHLINLDAEDFRMAVLECIKIKKDASKDDLTIAVKGYSKKNRKNPTAAEQIVHKYLKLRHIVHQRQVPMKAGEQYYIVDFLVGSKKNGFILEVDGGYHFTPEQMEKDEIRTNNLNGKGYQLIRISNEEVYMGDFSKIDDALINSHS